MPKKKFAVPVTSDLDAARDPLLLSDREINKQTGIWKRAQEQIGIPLPPETKAKISSSLTGRCWRRPKTEPLMRTVPI